MKDQFKDLPLRSGVGIVVLNKDNKVFVAKRIDNPKNFWQMPQGGVDQGEDLLTAAYRELEEETSIKNVELIDELDGFTSYNLPDHLLGIIWRGKYKGQKQKWFLMKYLGEDYEFVFGANLKQNEFGHPLFANFFFFITGFHGFHVFSGVIINIIVFIMVIKNVLHERGHYEMVEKVGLYWHFVDLVWVFVFTFFYLI